MKDPRNSNRYKTQRTHYINNHKPVARCVLCGQLIDMHLPGTHPEGPTIEHRFKVSHMQQLTSDWQELIAMCCDTSTWALAHRQCQNRQGAQVVNARKQPRKRW